MIKKISSLILRIIKKENFYFYFDIFFVIFCLNHFVFFKSFSHFKPILIKSKLIRFSDSSKYFSLKKKKKFQNCFSKIFFIKIFFSINQLFNCFLVACILLEVQMLSVIPLSANIYNFDYKC